MVIGSTDVAARVHEALMEDPRTRNAVVDVAFERGIATLTGTVASEEVRQAAEEVARQTSGVVTVVNELRLK